MAGSGERASYGRLVDKAFGYWFSAAFRPRRERIRDELALLAKRRGGSLEADRRTEVFPLVAWAMAEARGELRLTPGYQDRHAFEARLTLRSARIDPRTAPFPVVSCLSVDRLDTDFGAPWMQPFSTRSESFDRRFVSRTLPGAPAAAMFGPAVRDALLQAYFASPSKPNLAVDAQADFLRLQQSVPLDALGADRLDALVEQGVRAFRGLEEWLLERTGALPGSIVFLAESEGQCRVCGELVTTRAVRCARCETTHHEECWEWNGRCAIYGCDSREHRGVSA